MKGGNAREAVENEVDHEGRDEEPPAAIVRIVQVAFVSKRFDDGDKARAKRGRG